VCYAKTRWRKKQGAATKEKGEEGAPAGMRERLAEPVQEEKGRGPFGGSLRLRDGVSYLDMTVSQVRGGGPARGEGGGGAQAQRARLHGTEAHGGSGEAATARLGAIPAATPRPGVSTSASGRASSHTETSLPPNKTLSTDCWDWSSSGLCDIECF